MFTFHFSLRELFDLNCCFFYIQKYFFLQLHPPSIVSLANFGVGGMASAYQLLEISHTHYWTKVSIPAAGDITYPLLDQGKHTSC